MTERKIAVRPDGDLTVEGTSVWLPADLDALAKERNEVMQRVADIDAAKRYLVEQENERWADRIDGAFAAANGKVGTRANVTPIREMSGRDRRWWVEFAKAVRGEG